MKITVCGSLSFSERMLEVQEVLERRGHTVLVSSSAKSYAGKTNNEKETLTVKNKTENDAIRNHWEKIKQSDAILVLNYDKRGIKNYIGGNTLMEIGFAHVLNKKIFLLNPIPDIPYYTSEIEAAKPVILHGNVQAISD